MSSMKAKIGTSRSFARARTRPAISADCTGDPPGELTCNATAWRPRTAQARSMVPASAGRLSAVRSGDGAAEIAPASRTTGTTGGLGRKGSGNIGIGVRSVRRRGPAARRI